MLLSNFSENIRDGGRWESDHSGEACFFLKSRACGVCHTAQAKTLKISDDLWRDHIPVFSKSFFKNCTTCKGVRQPYGLQVFAVVLCCKTTSVWPIMCSKSYQEFDDWLWIWIWLYCFTFSILLTEIACSYLNKHLQSSVFLGLTISPHIIISLNSLIVISITPNHAP